ncbi:hypothetical protein HNQ94_002065 [Salirhabdus euzebyi]|uniref:DUF8042 domain-containing protein n=1 Tax=Salirhabdus euzebyi TaxID=394506 RepID=A0A841Q5D2_9BACI|nr:hypothetical protein [Salirhabdus euzebyi]MBB6453616.1 hypothetical protein [Salirhabdus euzebyi]
MQTLKGTQVEFLQRYFQLLDSMNEGFDYLMQIPDLEHSDMANTLYGDLVHAFQQLHEGHRQMMLIFDDLELHLFENLVELMTKWFDHFIDKRELLSNQVIPVFREWKCSMEQLIQPYIVH